MKTIGSRQNPLVREFRELAANTDVTGTRLLLDGPHQVREALLCGAALEAVAISSARLDVDSEEGSLARELDAAGVPVFAVTASVLTAISPVRTPAGIVAIATRTPVTAEAICTDEHGLVMAAVDIQDPGNLGSLIRAAEAGGATGALVCGASANPFSWKALRGSMGSTLRLPVAAGVSVAAAVRCAATSGARTIASVPRGGRDPDAVDWTGHIVLLLGGEGPGLSESIASQCDDRVTIPMAAAVESLNVAVAGAILVYAARRQRMRLQAL